VSLHIKAEGMPEPIANPSAGELVRLLIALEQDEAVPKDERARRDRLLRQQIGPEVSDIERIRAWLNRVDSNGERVSLDARDAVSNVTVIIVLLGLVAGMVAATGVLYYDGSGRVNVLAVLGILVVLPFVLMTFSWVAALSSSSAVLGDSLQWLGKASPGRWVPTLGRWLPEGKRRALDVLLGLRMHDEAGIAKLRRWLILRWSHVGGVAFFIGVLVVYLALVLFTDLAFGWSTTLLLSDDFIEGLVAALASPWAWFLSDALPSREVIEATRFYRSGDTTALPSDPSVFGLAIVVYGLIPRVVSLVIAGRLLARALTLTYLQHPQARTLLDRLSPSPVESQGLPDAGPPEQEDAAEPAITWPPCRPGGYIVNWSDVPLGDDALVQATGGQSVSHAGGARTLVQDDALVDALRSEGPAIVVVVTKAWEPPVLDLRDFLDALARGGSIAVELLPLVIDGAIAGEPGARDRTVWQRAFASSDYRLVSPRELAP
jgi:hypothetical protein